MRKNAVDSSANLLNDDAVSSISISLSLGNGVYFDDDNIDSHDFISKMEDCKGKTTSAFPSVAAWKGAMEGYDEAYCVSLTSKISGCYNAVCP